MNSMHIAECPFVRRTITRQERLLCYEFIPPSIRPWRLGDGLTTVLPLSAGCIQFAPVAIPMGMFCVGDV
jgi:hypothetical protein